MYVSGSRNSSPRLNRPPAGRRGEIIQGATGELSPSQSPRRHRKHKPNDQSSPPVPNGHVQNELQQGDDIHISLSALTRGRIPDSFEIEEDSLLNISATSIKTIPNIECGSFSNSESPEGETQQQIDSNEASNEDSGILNDSLGEYTSLHVDQGIDIVVSTSPSSVSPSDTLNTGTTHSSTSSSTFTSTSTGSSGTSASVSASGTSDQSSSTPTAAMGQDSATQSPGGESPPPLPPRLYTPPGEQNLNQLLTNRAPQTSNAVDLNMLNIGNFPPRENQASFDSMQAFAGSRENINTMLQEPHDSHENSRSATAESTNGNDGDISSDSGGGGGGEPRGGEG